MWVMTPGQHARQNHTLQITNKSFERMEQFKYLGLTLTNQNSINEELTNSSKTGNACYHSVQNRLTSILLSKNIKLKIYRTIILPIL